MNEYGWSDDQQKTLTVGFDFEAIEGYDLTPNPDDVFRMASEGMQRMFKWVYQPPCSDVDGFVCRSIVACWIFVPQLRSYTMTEMAQRFGKQKQSLGRWVADFKREFPDVTAHIQHIKNT